ncbi:MAG: DUF3387 domain-containing protein [Verrucomicrobia bacterium]|nr:DUF3387 domain-containing protein [Verrucomicrobiota bacterium]
MGLVPEALDGTLVTNEFPLFQANKDRLDLGYPGWLSKTAGFVDLFLQQEGGKRRFVQVVTELSLAFALCAASDEATALRDDVSFFQALQAALNQQSGGSNKTPEQIDAAIRQLVSSAITTDGQVIDVFTAAGLKQPDISILDDRFLAEIRELKHKNVAVELLENLPKDELKLRWRKSCVTQGALGRIYSGNNRIVVRNLS